MSTREAMLRQSRFMTFDGAVSAVTAHQRPDRYRHLEADLGLRKRIARGAGLSYSAASFGEGVVVQEMTAFDRLLAFDESTRMLKVEAGATLERVLAWAHPRSLRLAVVPGYPRITIGGCIAADVHGKNPLRDGTFCDWVEALTIFHPARGFRSITHAADPEAFEAACGGFGLTGLIVDATLRLVPAGARNVKLEAHGSGSLAEAAERLQQAADSDFAYSWHDGTSRGARFGNGIVFIGRWTDARPSRSTRAYFAMSSVARARWPISMWNRATVWAANSVYHHLATTGPARVQSAFDAEFPFARQTFYHRMYGRPGLAEMQLLVPQDRLPQFIEGLARIVADIDPPLVLMSMKRFAGRTHSLAMSGTGMLVALDLARSDATARFATAIDALALDMGAQPNAAKDSRLPAQVAAAALPHYARFRDRIHRLDPDRLYESELSRRLEL